MAPRKTGKAATASAKSVGPSKSKSVQPMITSLFNPARPSKPSVAGPSIPKKAMSRRHTEKRTSSLAGRKRMHGEVEEDDDLMADITLVEGCEQASSSGAHLSHSRRTASPPRSNYNSPRTSEADRTLVSTPSRIPEKLAVIDVAANMTKRAQAGLPSFTDLPKAWAGQHLTSSDKALEERMYQASLSEVGVTRVRLVPPRKAKDSRRAFDCDFEDEEDLDFDDVPVPSSQSPIRTALLSPAGQPLPSSRSPSLSLLSPVKSFPLEPHPPPVNQTTKVVLPSSQTQVFSQLSPVSRRSPVLLVPSSQTQQYDPLSPVRPHQTAVLHTQHTIPSHVPTTIRRDRRPALKLPNALDYVPSSQEGERSALLTPASKRSHSSPVAYFNPSPFPSTTILRPLSATPTIRSDESPIAYTNPSQDHSAAVLGLLSVSPTTVRQRDLRVTAAVQERAAEYYTESIPFTGPPSSHPSVSSSDMSSMPESFTRTLFDVLEEGEADTTRRLEELEQGRFGQI